MIFVTVGTHEQQFDRLIKHIDEMIFQNIIDEQVVMQIGYSTYFPKYCEYSKLFTYNDMQYYINNARIIITHGGPSSFILPLRIGKIPIVIPRRKEYGEHVNNHQVTFIKEVSNRHGNIIMANEVSELDNIIQNYDNIIQNMSIGNIDNNINFNKGVTAIINSLFYKRT